MPETTRRRSGPSAMLPLAFLLPLALGVTQLSLNPLLRLVHCDSYREHHPETILIPELDACSIPSVEKLISRDTAVYLAVSTVLPIVLSGFYGRLLDTKGRKYVMLRAASIGAVGDLWLYATASSQLLQSSWSIFLAALVKGMSANLVTLSVAQYVFVADVSSPRTRSFSIALIWLASWLGGRLSRVANVTLVRLQQDSIASTLAIAVGIWALYILYVAVFLPETLPKTANEEPSPLIEIEEPSHRNDVVSTTNRTGAYTNLDALWDPFHLIFHRPLVRSLLFVSLALYFSEGVLGLLDPYHDRVFGEDPVELGIIVASKNFSSVFTLLLLLPLFLTIYRCVRPHRAPAPSDSENASPTEPPTERTALLFEDSSRAPSSNSLEDRLTANTARQELILCAGGLVLQSLGVLSTWDGQNWLEVSAAMLLFGVGAAAGPSLWSLVILATPSTEMGRVLAGLSALNAAATALRGPVFDALFNATCVRMPGFVWLVASGVLAAGAVVVCRLSPRQFTS